MRCRAAKPEHPHSTRCLTTGVPTGSCQLEGPADLLLCPSKGLPLPWTLVPLLSFLGGIWDQPLMDVLGRRPAPCPWRVHLRPMSWGPLSFWSVTRCTAPLCKFLGPRSPPAPAAPARMAASTPHDLRSTLGLPFGPFHSPTSVQPSPWLGCSRLKHPVPLPFPDWTPTDRCWLTISLTRGIPVDGGLSYMLQNVPRALPLQGQQVASPLRISATAASPR